MIRNVDRSFSRLICRVKPLVKIFSIIIRSSTTIELSVCSFPGNTLLDSQEGRTTPGTGPRVTFKLSYSEHVRDLLTEWFEDVNMQSFTLGLGSLSSHSPYPLANQDL